MLSTETEFMSRNTRRLKVREWIQVFNTDGNQLEAGVAVFILDRLDFKIKTVIRDKGGHHVIIKGSIQEEDTAIVNIYASNAGEPNL